MITGPPWSSYQRLWRRHAESPQFAGKLARALAICRDGAKRGRLYASLSGGKDSVAMVGVMVEAGLGRFQCAHATTSLTLPGSAETAVAACEWFDLPLDAEEPGRDPLDLLTTLPQDASIFDEANWQALMRVAGSGNLMVNYAYKSHLDRERFPGGGFTVAFVGLRADESRGRKMSLQTHGAIYQSKVDAVWRICPLAEWSARDVFAFTTSRDLPVHPHYRWYAEELGLDPETARTDLVLAPDGVSARGGMQHLRRLYLDAWRKLVAARPEVARYG